MTIHTKQLFTHKSFHAVVLLVLILSGFTLRVWNLNFDQGLGTHPDERSTVCFVAPSIGWPRSLEEFRDPQRSPLNPLWDMAQQRPRSYTYGHLPLYMGIVMGEAFHTLAPLAERVGAPAEVVAVMMRGNEACGGIAVAGRFVIVLLDTLTILLVFLLGRRAFSSEAGLVAAAFYAFTAQAIQLSHFYSMDPASTTFTAMAVLGGVAMVQERSLRSALLTGIAAGLAIASKFSALPVVAVPITASVLWFVMALREGQGQAARLQARAISGLILALVMTGVTFFVTSPYAVLDWKNFAQATLVEQGQMVRGLADMPFTRQYRNTTPYLYFIQQQVQWGLGWPLGVLALGGTLVAAIGLVRTLAQLVSGWVRGRLAELSLSDSAVANVVMWSWVAPYFGITGAFLAKFNRYMSPILPFVVIFGAGLLWMVWRWGIERRAMPEEGRSGWYASARIGSGAVGTVMGAVVVVCALLWSVAYVNGIHGREHTWITASRWIYQSVPRGSLILWESWDDALPKVVPNEPGMDMGTTGLTNIDWSPYEEDTAEKYAILKEKLTEADFVVYSSKRIYDSVDELPERYPMTNLYYEAMWDGRLGFELAAEFTSPPRLFGVTFDDRDADESWSLYDHPQVSVFRKVRQLSDAEFDALFDRSWEGAIPYYRGQDSPLSPLLEVMGLGSQPGSDQRGVVSALIGLLSGKSDEQSDAPANRPTMLLDEPLSTLPLVDNYRWNQWASERPLAAALVWWAVVALLGVAAWPICFALFAPWLDRGYLFGRTMGWLLAGWLLWMLASAGWLYNTVQSSWFMVGVLVAIGSFLAWRQRHAMADFLRARWGLLLAEEALLAVAYGLFVLIRMANPDLWQPWLGGEKFMEFAFLNGVLRSPTFPPVDPHFAGGHINYYYFGLYLVAYLIKLTGIYAEVAFNLAIPMLFALTVGNAFAVAHTAWHVWRPGVKWQVGFVTALLGPFFVVLMGNLDGYGQIARQLIDRSPVQLQSALPGVMWLVHGVAGMIEVLFGRATLPSYNFWSPSRVIPATINEFPYWSFLFADLHPHLIGIPVAVLFLGVLFSILLQYGELWANARRLGVALLLVLAFLLGTLSSVNLWELPTYLGLGVLTLLVGNYRRFGRVRALWSGLATGVLLVGMLLFYLPFFASYVNIGASGIGLVQAGDEVGTWLLVWGGLGFMVVSWLLWALYHAGLPYRMPMPVRQQEVMDDRRLEAEDGVLPAIPLVGKDLEPGELTRTTGGETRAGGETRIASSTLSSYEPTVYYLPDIEDEKGIFEGNEVVGTIARNSKRKHSGVARVIGMSMRRFERLPRLWYLHRLLVQSPTLGYLLGVAMVPVLLVLALVSALLERGVLALCLAMLAVGLPLLWRRDREADSADHLASLLAVTGIAILAGTQVIYMKDFLQGGDWYRMNTLFKFFSQVWVLWGISAAIALPRIWHGLGNRLWNRAGQVQVDPSIALESTGDVVASDVVTGGMMSDEELADSWFEHPTLQKMSQPGRGLRLLWRSTCVALIVASSVFLIFGTPSRLSERFVGWVPPFGTLDGLAFMEQGRYSWPDDSHSINLSYDSAAIQWLLSHVRGNLVIVESNEIDYYRAGGTRVASMTGLSGLRGMHASEQRYGEQVGLRSELHREFWSTPSVERTEELFDQLQIALIYVGQLEQHQHPEGVQKLAQMVAEGRLEVLYQNEGVAIYAVPGRLEAQADGWFAPVPMPLPMSLALPLPLPLPSMRLQPSLSSELTTPGQG